MVSSMLREIGLVLVVASSLLVIGGCTENSANDSMHNRQEAAMRDPYRYSPDMSQTDISGGGIGNFDQKAFSKDLNDFINP
jgi:hypothetical protein